MKKKFNKKKLVFGILGIFALALVSAALVGYLSNMQTGTITVESPLELIGGEFTILSANAFEPISQDFTLENKVNTAIPVVVETKITSSEGMFSDSNFGEEFEYFLIGLEKPRDSNDVVIVETCSVFSNVGYAGSDELSTYDLNLGDDDGYCYWNAKTDEHWTGVEGGVYYVQMGDTQDTEDGIPALGTMYGRTKLQFKTSIAPATYTFTTQAFAPSEAKNLYDI